MGDKAMNNLWSTHHTRTVLLVLTVAACGDNWISPSRPDTPLLDASARDSPPDVQLGSIFDAPTDSGSDTAPPVPALISLEILNGDQVIQLGRTRQVKVFGRYSDDPSMSQDITRSIQGTRYTVSQLSDIITCSADGLVTSLGLGFATLAVTNSGLVTSVSVHVVEPIPTTVLHRGEL